MIVIKDLYKTYNTGTVKVEALKNVNITVNDGDFLAVMGPSGSGKSTMMNILGLLDYPSEGSYLLDGVDTRSLDERQLAILRNGKLGFVFQSFNLLPRLNTQRNVELPLFYAGVGSKQRQALATAALERVGLISHAGHRPNELSGGQKQRVAIARAMINNPSLLLADEPTGNLDSASSYEIMSLFQELHRQGSTIILVTHEPEIARHAQQIVHFRDGRIVNSEKVDQPLDARRLLEEWLEQGGLA
ncbi:ABC transporter ATP-binding protein [Desulfosporosinus sp. BG]|uniref:ABC transporter ATP-binding protein n=1 Tax=Desulfosporosinus sp. BG TaxID=1633135 RepID=UPI00083AE1C4|nr:ABC transporter ATP-binding protein [Desulfosporosinus sp. BG]ODA42917.1 ABC transporter ATP-binding protein [Desulfosporosinus sp. BG]